MAAETLTWLCGHCNQTVAALPIASHPSTADADQAPVSTFLACPSCGKGTVRVLGQTFPPSLQARPIEHVDEEVAQTWHEVRLAHAVGAYTGAVILCRKLLMHMACDRTGADAGLKFVDYIDILINSGELPKSHQDLLHSVREAGNRATHLLESVNRHDATLTIRITEACLFNLYEIPGMS